jgi:hypothetical protein
MRLRRSLFHRTLAEDSRIGAAHTGFIQQQKAKKYSAETSHYERFRAFLFFLGVYVFHSTSTMRTQILHMACEAACKAVENAKLATLGTISRKKIPLWKTILLGHVVQKDKIAHR